MSRFCVCEHSKECHGFVCCCAPGCDCEEFVDRDEQTNPQLRLPFEEESPITARSYKLELP